MLHATGLLCRAARCPTGGCLCAEAASFIRGVTLGSGHGRTHGIFWRSFSGPLLGQAVVAVKRGFILPLQADAGRTWLSWKSRRGSTSFPRQRAELRARVGLLAIGSYSGCEEAEPACIRTLGVLGTGVGAGCPTPHNGSQYPLGSIPHAVECPCPPCLCWPQGGNCQEGAALSRNHFKLELCQKYFHPSAGKNSGPCLQGTVLVWPQL